MVASILKRLLVALIALAFVGGAPLPVIGSVAAAPSAEAKMAMTASVPCDQMDMAMPGMGAEKSAPCNTLNFDCMLKMGCFTTGATLSVLPATLAVPVAYDAVSYELASLARSGLSLAPDPFPPKTLV